MQTIIVTVNNVIASIYNDPINTGRYVGIFAHGEKYGEIKNGVQQHPVSPE